MGEGNLLSGKVTFITGGAQGIGLAVARAFAAQGSKLVLADIEADKVRQAAQEFGKNAHGLAIDVTDENQTENALAQVIDAFGKVDIVVPNAGVLVLQHAVDTEIAAFRRVVDVNLTGAFITAKVFARRLIDQGTGGRIVLTSSLFGLRGGRENSAYSASKFGMIGLMQCLAAELAEHDILANCVCPGQMDTDMIRQLFRDRAQLTGQTEDDVRQSLESRIPVGHLGPLDQLAGTYVYLASDLSRYVTGQSITVDGGWQIG
ncbi:MAG: SDR family NAD(P)-dependent oxidoreductase [Aestuariivirgaceae bacterium]